MYIWQDTHLLVTANPKERLGPWTWLKELLSDMALSWFESVCSSLLGAWSTKYQRRWIEPFILLKFSLIHGHLLLSDPPHRDEASSCSWCSWISVPCGGIGKHSSFLLCPQFSSLDALKVRLSTTSTLAVLLLSSSVISEMQNSVPAFEHFANYTAWHSTGIFPVFQIFVNV